MKDGQIIRRAWRPVKKDWRSQVCFPYERHITSDNTCYVKSGGEVPLPVGLGKKYCFQCRSRHSGLSLGDFYDNS